MSVAFVMGGGGRWGAIEVGMLRALVEAGIRPDRVVGTSIGAINGAFFAADPSLDGVAALEDTWTTIEEHAVLTPRKRDQLRNLVRLAPSLVSHAPLENWLDEHLPVDRFEQLRLPFQCVASSVERAAEHWFDSGPLTPALLASASIPGIFPPAEIDGEHFYDGGIVNSVPVDRAVALGATTIYVLHVGRLENDLQVPTRWFEAGLVAFEIARRHRFATLNERLPHGVTVHVLPSGHDLRPDDRRQLKWSDFSETAALMERGHEAAAAYLAGLPDPDGTQAVDER